MENRTAPGILKMSIHNRLYNWWHGVKRLRQFGCRNIGVMANRDTFVTYDWSKPTTYRSRRYSFEELGFGRRRKK